MLKEIIERIYNEFSEYKLNLPLSVCTACCMTTEEVTTLISLPVREIPRDLLATYNDSAKPEKTPINEFKHFLPRYIDLISQFNFPTHSPELSFSRLTPFDKNEWTDNELNILQNFQLEYFKHCLRIYPIPSSDCQIDSILIMFWESSVELDTLLITWEETESLESTLHFKDLYFEGFKQDNQTKKLANSFGNKELSRNLANWIEAPKIKLIFQEKIEKIIFSNFVLEEQVIYELNLLHNILTINTK